jgi:proline iminopeptidase
MIVLVATGFLILISLIAWNVGVIGPKKYVYNYEITHPDSTNTIAAPMIVSEGLAIYSSVPSQDKKTPILLFPYPHSDAEAPMLQSDLAKTLQKTGRQIISFDPPGAFHSTREPDCSMAEMLQCGAEALEKTNIEFPVIAAGHSMGSLCALAFSIEHPHRVRSLILIGSMSGFPAVARHGYPKSYWKWYKIEFWRFIWKGLRVMNGQGNLADHKRFMNLHGGNLFVNPRFFEPWEVLPGDEEIGVPIRARWPLNMWKGVDYSGRLAEVGVPALICAGRHDPETPTACNEELNAGIPNSRLVIFEKSGHFPYIEEPELFMHSLSEHLEALPQG